jgi:MFS family permease
MMSSIFYLGMIFGAFLTGKIADSKGRKNTIIHSGIL